MNTRLPPSSTQGKWRDARGMVSMQLQRNDARAIVEWVLGVTARPPRETNGPDFDLWEKGEPVGALLVVSAAGGAGGAWSGSPAVVNEVIEDEAWRAENLARFGGVERGERHLFVWLGEDHGEAFRAMGPDETPEAPLPPRGITTLWVARRPAARAGWLADRVWQTNPRGEWEALEAVPRSCDHGAARQASLSPLALQRR